MKSISGIINLIILVFIILVCVKNSASTSVDFVFTVATMPQFVLLLLTFVLGMFFGKTAFGIFKKNK